MNYFYQKYGYKPNVNTDFFDILNGVLQGGILAEYRVQKQN